MIWHVQTHCLIIKPTYDEKLSWLQITDTPGTRGVNLAFSKTLIRQYVLAQAGKFQAGGSAPMANQTDGAYLVTQKGTIINNIDEVTDGLVKSLTSGQVATQKLTSKIGTYNTLVSAAQ
jgi:hypothetical protein